MNYQQRFRDLLSRAYDADFEISNVTDEGVYYIRDLDSDGRYYVYDNEASDDRADEDLDYFDLVVRSKRELLDEKKRIALIRAEALSKLSVEERKVLGL
jgi:hypothetical protein